MSSIRSVKHVLSSHTRHQSGSKWNMQSGRAAMCQNQDCKADSETHSQKASSKALVAVASPREHLKDRHGSNDVNNASNDLNKKVPHGRSNFISHLLAVENNVPQMRKLRRREPASVQSSYADSMARKVKLMPKGYRLSLSS